MSLQYDQLGAANLWPRLVLLFKEKEVHRQLQIKASLICTAGSYLLRQYFFFYLLRALCVLKVKGTPSPTLGKYHQGAFEQHAHTHTRTDALTCVAGEDCGGTREPTSSLGESSLQLSPRVRAFRATTRDFSLSLPCILSSRKEEKKKRTSSDTLSVKVAAALASPEM